MDPLSITASVIAILQLSNTVYKAAREYYTGVKAAPKEIKRLLEELEAFNDILIHLSDITAKAERNDKGSAPHETSHKGTWLPSVTKLLEPDAALRLCFAEMQQFMDRVTIQKSKTKKALKWPFQKEEIYQTIGRLQKLQSLLEFAIATDNVSLGLQSQSSLDSIKKSLESTTLSILDRNILQWLDAPDPSGNYNAGGLMRQQGTGIWILQDPSFMAWKSTNNSFLWIHGKPGCGKSVLSSTIISHLVESSLRDGLVAYFYFDFQRQEQQTVEGFLRSLIRQIAVRESGIHEFLRDIYKSCSNGEIKPATQSLVTVLHKLLETSKSVNIVIDAADECNARNDLLPLLKEMNKWNIPGLRLLVTSRREKDIEDALSSILSGRIPLEESGIDSDIRDFIHHMVHSDESKLLKWPRDIRSDIETTLLKGADGMFRWVVCQLDALQVCLKPRQVRMALESLPTTLEETYARILAKIPEQHSEDARRILQCLITAFHPLDVKEVAEIVAINPSEGPIIDFDNKLCDHQDVLAICSSLVSIIPSTRGMLLQEFPFEADYPFQELRLAHYSVKEYLISNRVESALAPMYSIDERLAHDAMAEFCIRYLLQFDQDDLRQDRPIYQYGLLENAPFAPYAARCWVRHFRAAGPDKSSASHRNALTFTKNPRIICNAKKLRQGWVDDDGGYYSEQGDNWDIVTPLYFASLQGLIGLVSTLLDSEEDVHSRGPRGTALAAACCRGDADVVQLLLRAGANVELDPDSEWQNDRYAPLNCAVKDGHEAVVGLLLAEGADVNVRLNTKDMRTLIGWAVYRQNIAVVRHLISAGADVNYGRKGVSTPLQTACKDGAEGMVDLILRAGARVNDEPGPWGNSLASAICGGNVSIVNKLQSLGGRFDLLPGIDEFVLTFLEQVGETDWVIQARQLLSMSILRDSEQLTFVQTSLLRVAASRGHQDLVDMMLQIGTDVNLQDSGGETPLTMAVRTTASASSIVRFLLQHGADVDTAGGEYTALVLAAGRGNADAVGLLLEHGADVNYVSMDGSALALATTLLNSPRIKADIHKRARYQAVVDRLLEYGARHIRGRRSEIGFWWLQ